MRHLDLFSGIGGFAYAADQVFGDVEHIFCDNEPFAQAVLKKHWPESDIIDDIKKIYTNPFDKRLEGQQQKQTTRHRGQSNRTGQDEESRPFILTGGFPCQPFSAAGLRRGTADDRHLWPEMLRVIRLTEPEWVIAENVRGITTWSEGLVFEQVCADLEASGYEVQPFIIPAVAVNAPHRRDRVWFVAHRISTGSGDNGRPNNKRRETSKAGPEGIQPENGDTSSDNSQSSDSDASYAPSGRRQRRGSSATAEERYATRPEPSGQLSGRFEGQDSYASNSRRLRGQPGRGEALRPESQEPERADGEQSSQGYSWERDWSEVAAELCRVDDGLSAGMGGLELSKSQHRKAQLKAYGNAIVPQVAIEIMQAIKESATLNLEVSQKQNQFI